MSYAVVNVPAAPVRRKPDHRREMVSQLLFGESVVILKSKGDLWLKVRSLHDNYEGWITRTQLKDVDEATATAVCNYVSFDVMGTLTTGGNSFQIPIGSTLPFFEEKPEGKKGGKGKMADLDYSYTGQALKREEQILSPESLKKFTAKWLNAPYLWGGRTPLGVDCSGFVQVIFKSFGIDLPRDAWQQAQEGRAVKKYSEICPGDLAFFHNKEDITHVGILLGNEEVIHASGRVRIDVMTKKGIWYADTGKKGPRLKTIRRIWH